MMVTRDRQSQWRRRAIEFILLALVLGTHGWVRAESAQRIGHEQRHFYSRDYNVALAIMLDRGFELLGFDLPAGAPLREFTMRQRERLDEADLIAFDVADRARPPIAADSRTARRRNEYSRVFELYIAAGLWSIFGIDWGVITAFYIGVSMLCGLLVFLTARRISGSFGCGLMAAGIFALSPYEAENVIVSIRDTNPLWFTIIAYWAVTCVADRFRSKWANGLSFLVTGAASTIGLGWRPDASMLLPVTLVTLVAMLIWSGRRWWWIGVAALLFLVGAKMPMLLIGHLLPDDAPPRGTFQFLHVSYYADHTRSVILEQEDSFQTLRNDMFVFTLAGEFHEQDPVEQREVWDKSLWGPAYSNLMVRLFRDMAQYHMYDWVRGFPGVYVDALVDASSPDREHVAEFEWWLPWAAVLGGGLGLFVYRERAPIVLSLSVFTLFYGVVFLVVLPEEKHLAPFVCPLTLLGAIGLWLPFRLFAARGGASEFKPPFAFRRRWVVATGVTVVVVLAGAVFAARGLASAKRQEYLAAIAACEPTAVDVRNAIADPRVFAAMVEFAPDEQRGYLLDVAAGDRPSELVLRVGPEAGGLAPAFETRHALTPGIRQRFFWSCYRGWLPHGNSRSRYTVRLTGNAEIVAAQQLDLGPWHRLPFATVFTEDDRHAGSPGVTMGPAVSFLDNAAPRDEWGLSDTEAMLTSLGPPSRVVAGPDDPVCRAEAVGGSKLRVDTEGMWITSSADPGLYVAMFGVFTAPERGRYVFRLETWLEEGDFVPGLLSGDQSHWRSLAGTINDVVPGGEARIMLCDLDEGESVIAVLSNPLEAGVSEYLIRGMEIRLIEGID